MKKNYALTPLPRSYKGHVYWYVAPQDTSEPMYLLRTQAEALAFARALPAPDVNGCVMVHSVDWFNPLDGPISSKRKVIDLRLKLIPVKVLPALTEAGSFLLSCVRSGICVSDEEGLLLFNSAEECKDWVSKQSMAKPRRYILVGDEE